MHVAAGTRPQSKTITLAGGDEPPLDTWLNGVAPRVELQAEITWSGFNDGYVDGGAGDPANPYLLVFWRMEPTARHCADCPAYEAGSPYDPPWVQGGNQLNATPGDGHTECGAACKCSLEYGGPEDSATVDPRGDVWKSPNAPPAPPGPDGQPGKWPSIAAVDNIAELPTAQQEALQSTYDAYRTAAERWEAIRGALPSLPDMFAADAGGANWPAWDALSPAQQVALRAVFEAMAAYDVVAGSPSAEELAAATAGDQADMAALQAKLEGMADHLDDFVSELNQASDQDWQELFNKGPWKMFWWQLQQDFEAVLDWFYNRTPPQLSEADGGVALSGHQPGYTQNRESNGEWAPGGGRETEGGGGGESGGTGAHLSKSLRRRGHPPNTPEQKEAKRLRHLAAVNARAAAKRAERLAAMTEEERAAYLKRGEQVAAGRARTPEERAAHRQEWFRTQQNANREAERQAYRSPEELAVPVPHVKADTPENNRLLRAYQAQLKVARAAYKARMEREHADARARVAELRTQHAGVKAKLAAAGTDAERAPLREHLRGIVAEHNKLVTWIRENPIPTELSEPGDAATDRPNSPGTGVLDTAPGWLYTNEQSSNTMEHPEDTHP